MSDLPILEIDSVIKQALDDWSSPNKRFASGKDPRSSENALLALTN